MSNLLPIAAGSIAALGYALVVRHAYLEAFFVLGALAIAITLRTGRKRG